MKESNRRPGRVPRARVRTAGSSKTRGSASVFQGVGPTNEKSVAPKESKWPAPRFADRSACRKAYPRTKSSHNGLTGTR